MQHNRSMMVSRSHSVDPTLLQASLHTQSNIGRDQLPELFDIFALKGEIVLCGCLHDLLIKSEEGLCDLLNAWILARETGNKDGVFAIGVELGMQGALRGDGHLLRPKRVVNGSSFILKGELRLQCTLDHDIDLRAAWICVRSVEAARTEESYSHGDAGADQTREGFTIRADGMTSKTFGQ